MKNMIPTEELRELILIRFGSQKEFGESIGLTDAQVSRAIKNPTPKFIAKCKEAGLDIESIMDDRKKDEKKTLNEKVARLEKRIDELEKLVQQKDEIIKQQNNLLEKSDNLMNGYLKSGNNKT